MYVGFFFYMFCVCYFLYEWLFYQFWEQEDVFIICYDFVELQFNGESLGVYVYEEYFEK